MQFGGWGERLNKSSVCFFSSLVTRWWYISQPVHVYHMGDIYCIYCHFCHMTLWSTCVTQYIHSLACQTFLSRNHKAGRGGVGQKGKTTEGLDKMIQFSCNAARILAAPIRLQRRYESYYITWKWAVTWPLQFIYENRLPMKWSCHQFSVKAINSGLHKETCWSSLRKWLPCSLCWRVLVLRSG